MKKLIAIAVMIVVMLSSASAELYPRFGNIVDIEYDVDFVTVDDGLGNLWDFYSAPLSAYYNYGDLILMLMDDGGTPEWIYDDKVIDACYCDNEAGAEFARKWRDDNRDIFQSFTGFFPY